MAKIFGGRVAKMFWGAWEKYFEGGVSKFFLHVMRDDESPK